MEWRASARCDAPRALSIQMVPRRFVTLKEAVRLPKLRPFKWLATLMMACCDKWRSARTKTLYLLGILYYIALRDIAVRQLSRANGRFMLIAYIIS
eukprot:6205483-Pleurochrysis_carterae.AAC.1